MIERMSMQRLRPLLTRAAMDKFSFASGVVRSTDNEKTHKDRRICISKPYDVTWGDCVALTEYLGNSMWKEIALLSPARARILAEHLITAAERLEHDDPSSKYIDEAAP